MAHLTARVPERSNLIKNWQKYQIWPTMAYCCHQRQLCRFWFCANISFKDVGPLPLRHKTFYQTLHSRLESQSEFSLSFLQHCCYRARTLFLHTPSERPSTRCVSTPPPPFPLLFHRFFPFPTRFVRSAYYAWVCSDTCVYGRAVTHAALLCLSLNLFFYGADFSHKLCPWKLDCDFYLPRCQSSVEFYEPGQPSLMRGAMNPFGHYGTRWQVTHHNGDRVWQPRVTRAEQIRGINKASIFADFANYCDTF